MEVIENKLWLGDLSVEDLMQEFGSPLYVYEEDTIRAQYRRLYESFPGVSLQIHYAMKANPNPALLKILLDEGAWLDAVSPFETKLAREVGFLPEHILFTGNNIPLSELEYGLEEGLLINIESLSLLEEFGKAHPGKELSLRINPGMGSGHHAHCITGGPRSKFGIYYDQLDEIHEILTRYQLKLTGIHAHIGTGILEPEPMLEALDMILTITHQFSGLQFVDIGGGFGIPYRPEQSLLNLPELGAQISRKFLQFCDAYGTSLDLKIEPGRYLMASSGTLLATVNNIKKTPDYQFVGVDTGFNHLLRPALYGSYHRVCNASRMEGDEESMVLAGYICESGDVLTHNSEGMTTQFFPRPRLGDRLAILDAGAYGMAMSSQYNMRNRPAEVLVTQGKARLIRKRETYQDLIRGFVF
ncbi:MAG: diaminopimelate decarboxylase [SAR324 cluster bacterium]|nr:diaminopimelate decarboxylase [SAR324 cluster bacterium]